MVPLLIVVPVLGQPAGGDWRGYRDRPRQGRIRAGGAGYGRAARDARLVRIVARRRSTELFVLNVLLVTLAMAFLTGLAGLSLALGAFLAGMLISETEYRYQVEEEIKPFRDVLLGLFFVTVGMMLDLRLVFEQIWLVLALLVLLVAFKFASLARLRVRSVRHRAPRCVPPLRWRREASSASCFLSRGLAGWCPIRWGSRCLRR